MKKYNFYRKSFFMTLLFSITISIISQNQQNDGNAPVERLPLDPRLRLGRLDNGLTYYIQHNEIPKGRAEFYLVHDVGSLQEEDHQRGYAHFLEHLALRSSKNFPDKNGIGGYTKSKGLKTELSTGFDESVYKIVDVPTNRQSIIDSCLLILHDWTSFLLFDDEVIEEERDAVRVEWRTKHTPAIRLLEQQLPVMYPKSKYGVRLPIGIIGIIENFQKKDFLAYYNKWYTPEYQAIVIVGDIDVDKIEAQIKSIFSDMPTPDNPQQKQLYEVSDNEFPIISIAKEKEEKNLTLTIYYKVEPFPFRFKGTIMHLTSVYTYNILHQVINERFAELLKKTNTPFISTSANIKNYFVSNSKDAWTTTGTVKSNEIASAIKILIEETEKLKIKGITEKEYERARERIFKSYEADIIEKDKISNNRLANKYVNHFTINDNISAAEIDYEVIKQIASFFQVEQINDYIRFIFKDHDFISNIVISLTGPDDDKISYPTEEELLKMYDDACEEIVGASKEEISQIVLIPELPEPGEIISEIEDPLFETTNFELSNGVKVIVKKTDLKQNQILMSAISPGGSSQFNDEKDIWNLKLLNTIIRVNGLGDFSATALKRYSNFNNVLYNSGLTESSEILNGEATPNNLKALFEIIYLQFTGICPVNEVYAAAKEGIRTQLDNQNSNTATIFSDTIYSMAFNNHPRSNRLKSRDFDKIDYNRMIEMYKERFSDASDFVFVFVGDVDNQKIRPLIKQYLATLPSQNRKEIADESQIVPYQKGTIVKHFPMKLAEPESKIALLYTGTMPYNIKNLIITQSLNKILELKFYEKLLPYGYEITNLFTEVDLYDFPEGRTSIQIFIDANPEKQHNIIEIVKQEVTRLTEEGTDEEMIKKAYDSILSKRYEILQANDYWLNVLNAFYSRKFDSHTNYETILKSITKDDVKQFTKELINQGNLIEVVMYPETKKQ